MVTVQLISLPLSFGLQNILKYLKTEAGERNCPTFLEGWKAFATMVRFSQADMLQRFKKGVAGVPPAKENVAKNVHGLKLMGHYQKG